MSLRKGHAVYATIHQIEGMLLKLDGAVPSLLAENDGMDFWIEYLHRADAIKGHAGREHSAWIAARIDQIPQKYGVLPPSQWMAA